MTQAQYRRHQQAQRTLQTMQNIILTEGSLLLAKDALQQGQYTEAYGHLLNANDTSAEIPTLGTMTLDTLNLFVSADLQTMPYETCRQIGRTVQYCQRLAPGPEGRI